MVMLGNKYVKNKIKNPTLTHICGFRAINRRCGAFRWCRGLCLCHVLICITFIDRNTDTFWLQRVKVFHEDGKSLGGEILCFSLGNKE